MTVLVAIMMGHHRSALAQMCGDANDDGNVTVSDGVLALKAAAELPSVCTLPVCDTNRSGDVTVTDAVKILGAAAGVAVLDCPGGAPSSLAVAQVGSLMARVLLTVANQPIQIVGFANELDLVRRNAGSGQGLDDCELSSCANDGVPVSREEMGCLFSGTFCRQCAEAASQTTVTDQRHQCRSTGATIDGAISLAIPGSAPCGASAPLGGEATLRFCDLHGEGEGSISGTTTKSMIVDLQDHGGEAECLFAESTAILTGRLDVVGFRQNVDQTFVLEGTTLTISNATFAFPCVVAAYDLAIEGPVVFLDNAAGTSVRIRFEHVTTRQVFDAVTQRLTFTVGGRVDVDCLGSMSLQAATLVAPLDASCPDQGQISVTGTSGSRAIQFGPDGGVLVENVGGSRPLTFPSCVDPPLASTCPAP